MHTIQTDLETAQAALLEIIRILDTVPGGADRMTIYYAIGAATGTARSGVIMSGAGRRLPAIGGAR